METKPYTEDDVERIRRFLVRDLMAMQSAAKNAPKGSTQASREAKVQTIEDIIELVNDIFEVYTLDSTVTIELSTLRHSETEDNGDIRIGHSG